MQGDLVFDEKGKVTSRRVLDEATIEISFDAQIKIKGIDGMNMGTYTFKDAARWCDVWSGAGMCHDK